MRAEADREKIERFMRELGARISGTGRIYLTGGATAVLTGWREMTIDVDLKARPEPPGFFEAIAELKEAIDVNVELASPDDFIPEVPGWQQRSLFIARRGGLEFFHYDPYSQALAKLERGHTRDHADVRAMLDRGLINREQLRRWFEAIEPALLRYPAIESAVFRAAVIEFCQPPGIVQESLRAWDEDRLRVLPGWELIAGGLEDLAAGRRTPAACLVWIAEPRLGRHGILSAGHEVRRVEEPEATLYGLLHQEPGNAFGRYNSLLRRLVQFEHALDRSAQAR